MPISDGKGGVHNRRPSYRGTFYTYVRNGVEVQAKWPRKRGKKLHPHTIAQAEFFRQVQWAFKYSDPTVQSSYVEAVAGTPLMPRDLFLMAVSGRMHVLVRQDGKKIFPMAGSQSISDALDFVGQLPGQVLARGAEAWEAAGPAPEGYVLASNGPDAAPSWIDLAEGPTNAYLKGSLFSPAPGYVNFVIAEPVTQLLNNSATNNSAFWFGADDYGYVGCADPSGAYAFELGYFDSATKFFTCFIGGGVLGFDFRAPVFNNGQRTWDAGNLIFGAGLTYNPVTKTLTAP
jgi:hypothetical protein